MLFRNQIHHIYNKQPNNGRNARSKITNKLKGSDKRNFTSKTFFLR